MKKTTKNKSAVATAKTSTSTQAKGDPKKADKSILEEHAAELTLRAIFNVKGNTPIKTKLGPNEKAYIAQKQAEAAKEYAAAHRGQKKVYVVCSIGEGTFVALDSYKTLEAARERVRFEVADLTGLKVTEDKKDTKKASYMIDFTGDSWPVNESNRVAVVDVHAGKGHHQYHCEWRMGETYVQ